MKEVFAALYEWFGLIPFYSTDLADFLKGFDVTCTDYIGTPLYAWIGCSMIILTIVFYIIHYYFINTSRWNKRRHWWINAGVIFALNFAIAFLIPFNAWQNKDHCQQLNISFIDCVGFGFSNAVWSLILFTLITSSPIRKFAGASMTNTTFWKPKS